MTDETKMNSNQKESFSSNVSKKEVKSATVKALLFIFLAIPGLLLFLFFSLWIVVSFFSAKNPMPSIPLTILGLTIGSILLIYGTGKQREYKYIIVFISIPLSLFIYGILEKFGILKNDPLAMIVFIGLTLLFVNFLIKYHYRKNSKNIK
ncbi:MAG: hypothetical protein MUF15_24300 [Acidobacteria bacterium]|jgi:hypothetical protein|nr:hypothetical protein [Acidobacteriota bacterium]